MPDTTDELTSGLNVGKSKVDGCHLKTPSFSNIAMIHVNSVQ